MAKPSYTELHHEKLRQGYIPSGPYPLSELVKEDEGLGIIINSFQVRGTKIGRIEIISGGLVDADMEDLHTLYMVYILPISRESQPSEERRTADVETVPLVESYPVFGHRRRAEINPPPMH